MLIYYSLYALLISAAVLKTAFAESVAAKRNYCIFSFLLISLILALRHPSMGVDLQYGGSNGYLGMFGIISESSWNSVFHNKFLNYEKGYVVFCKLIGCISGEQQTILIFCAFISIGAISYLIYKYSENPLLSYSIFLGLPVFLLNYSGLRQVIAIAITAVSYVLIRNKKPLLFVLAVLLAASFHRSAIFFLIAYPVYYFKPMSRLRLFTVAALPAVYLLRSPLFSVLSRLFKDDAVPDNNSAITLFIIFCVIYAFNAVYSDKNDVHGEGLMNLFWLACFCQAFGGVYSTAIRVGYYFMIYLILLLPKTLSSIKNNADDNRKTYAVFTMIIFVCFSAFGLYSIYASKASWAMANPYHFFWQVI